MRNAITPDQRERVIALLEEASAQVEIGAVVLTATGDGFCTGADLRAGRRPAPPRPEGAPDRIMGDASRMIRRGAQRLVSAVIGQRFGQSVAAPVGVSGVVSAPNAYGKCDSVAIQVIPTANACASVQTEVLAKGELLGTLAGVPMFRDKQNMHVMLLPTSGNGCVIVALNNFYAE